MTQRSKGELARHVLARVAGLAVSIGPGLIGVGLATPRAAAAHETDQYTMPLDRPMADLGDYFDAVHFAALQAAVGKLNKETAAALADKDRERGEAELIRVR